MRSIWRIELLRNGALGWEAAEYPETDDQTVLEEPALALWRTGRYRAVRIVRLSSQQQQIWVSPTDRNPLPD